MAMDPDCILCSAREDIWWKPHLWHHSSRFQPHAKPQKKVCILWSHIGERPIHDAQPRTRHNLVTLPRAGITECKLATDLLNTSLLHL